jgi:O-acetyl-ADP-ribose deacetylase
MNGLSARRLTSRVAKNPGLGYGALRNADECTQIMLVNRIFGMHDDGPMASKHSAFSIGSAEVELLVGDITKIAVDAIVNAANSSLSGGGGVDGAIHRAAGPDLMRELDVVRARVGKCSVGSAVVTGAGKLPARYVFHAVGPIYRGGGERERELLRSCYTTCLDLADERQVHSISFPSISTGVYGYPIQEAAGIAIAAVRDWLARPTSVRLVKLVQFSVADHEVYCRAAVS